MQRLHVDGRELRRCVAAGTEYIGSSTLKLCLPRRDLIGVDVELFRKLRHRSIALDGGNAAAQLPAIDVKSLHAKIGALTLENDFLEGALTKAGLLSAKR